MVIHSDGIRSVCSNCNKCTTIATLHIGIFGISLCADCLKELGEMARTRAKYMGYHIGNGSPKIPLPEPISSLCKDLSEQNVKNQALQTENSLLRSVLKDAYMEANSEFTDETKVKAEKLIGPIVY